MSRAFVKEEDGDLPEDLPEIPVSPHTNYVTPRGLRLLQEQHADEQAALAQITDEQMNAKQQAALHERKLRWLNARISGAVLVPEGNDAIEEVAFGHYVLLLDEGENELQFQIVGEDESDPTAGKVSWRSPLAQALLGAVEGDEVVWPRPAGNLLVEILAISHQP